MTISLSAPSIYPEPPTFHGCTLRLAVPNRKVSLAEALAAILVEEGTMALLELETHCGPTEALADLGFHWRLKPNWRVLAWL